jgi:hypothetical protein
MKKSLKHLEWYQNELKKDEINLDNEKSRLINDIAKIKKEDILPKQIIPEKLTLWMRIKKVLME